MCDSTCQQVLLSILALVIIFGLAGLFGWSILKNLGVFDDDKDNE